MKKNPQLRWPGWVTVEGWYSPYDEFAAFPKAARPGTFCSPARRDFFGRDAIF